LRETRNSICEKDRHVPQEKRVKLAGVWTTKHSLFLVGLKRVKRTTEARFNAASSAKRLNIRENIKL